MKLLAAAALITLAACKGDAAPAPAAADVVRGYTAVTRLRSELQQALGRALVRGAPEALAACSTEAPAITARITEGGVVVGRATRKPRNPANAVAGWQAEALAQFEATAATGRRLDVQRFVRGLPGDRVGYAEPLVIQPLCVACHGAELEPGVVAALAERYPDDRATGYTVGELRGVIWAEVPRVRR